MHGAQVRGTMMGQEWRAITGPTMEDHDGAELGSDAGLPATPAPLVYTLRQDLPSPQYLAVLTCKEYRTGCGDDYPESWGCLGTPPECLGPEL